MVNIISISFDKRTKIIMGISVVIAILIMSYNFYNIIIKDRSVVDKKVDINDICEFEAKYTVKVNSNKNNNIYVVNEKCDFENNTSELIIENGITIKKEKDEISINNNSLEYKTNLDLNIEINYISLGDIICVYKKIKDNMIDAKVEKIEKNNNVTYRCYLKDKSINIIDIEAVDNSLAEVNIYDDENTVKYYIKIDNFVVKKTY